MASVLRRKGLVAAAFSLMAGWSAVGAGFGRSQEAPGSFDVVTGTGQLVPRGGEEEGSIAPALDAALREAVRKYAAQFVLPELLDAERLAKHLCGERPDDRMVDYDYTVRGTPSGASVEVTARFSRALFLAHLRRLVRPDVAALDLAVEWSVTGGPARTWPERGLEERIRERLREGGWILVAERLPAEERERYPDPNVALLAGTVIAVGLHVELQHDQERGLYREAVLTATVRIDRAGAERAGETSSFDVRCRGMRPEAQTLLQDLLVTRRSELAERTSRLILDGLQASREGDKPLRVEIEPRRLFTGWRSRYREQLPVARLTVRNDYPVDGVRLLRVEASIDGEEPLGRTEERVLSPGEAIALDVHAGVPRVDGPDASTAMLSVTVRYDLGGRVRNVLLRHPCLVYPAGRMIWQDPDRPEAPPAWVASYVTSEDPVVDRLARRVLEATRGLEGEGRLFPTRALRLTAAAWSLCEALGLGYRPDRASFDQRLARALDTVHSPAGLLGRAGGDCDDLSLFLASLLEAVDVETAILVHPGHVQAAALVTRDGAVAARFGPVGGGLVRLGAGWWIVLETTLLGRKGFVEAWSEGVERYLASEPVVRAITVRDAWTAGGHEPCGWTEERPPDGVDEAVARWSMQDDLDRLELVIVERVEREIERRMEGSRDPRQRAALLAAHGYPSRAARAIEDLAEEAWTETDDLQAGVWHLAAGEPARAEPRLRRALEAGGRTAVAASLHLCLLYELAGRSEEERLQREDAARRQAELSGMSIEEARHYLEARVRELREELRAR